MLTSDVHTNSCKNPNYRTKRKMSKHIGVFISFRHASDIKKKTDNIN